MTAKEKEIHQLADASLAGDYWRESENVQKPINNNCAAFKKSLEPNS